LKEYVDENAKKNIVTNLIPYGITKKEEELSRHISTKLLSDSKTSALFNCKLTLKKMLSNFDILAPESHVCDGIDDLQNEGVKFVEQHGQVVLKEIYGSGGSGLARINDVVQFIKVIDYMRRLDQHEGNIIIEKWYASKVSYNHQYVVRDGIIYQHAFSKQLISNNGKIRGSIFNQKTDYLLNIIDQHNTLSKPIAKEILKNGYQGIIGFDSVICADGSLFPVIDINCRINLSTIFYEILTRYFISNYACFFYKEYTLNAPLPFAILRSKIEHLAYSSTRKEGIVVLNFTSLNVNILRSKSKIGRVFYAIFAKSEQRAEEIYEDVFSDE
jgi:hypothetical protein